MPVSPDRFSEIDTHSPGSRAGRHFVFIRLAARVYGWPVSERRAQRACKKWKYLNWKQDERNESQKERTTSENEKKKEQSDKKVKSISVIIVLMKWKCCCCWCYCVRRVVSCRVVAGRPGLEASRRTRSSSRNESQSLSRQKTTMPEPIARRWMDGWMLFLCYILIANLFPPKHQQSNSCIVLVRSIGRSAGRSVVCVSLLSSSAGRSPSWEWKCYSSKLRYNVLALKKENLIKVYFQFREPDNHKLFRFTLIIHEAQ